MHSSYQMNNYAEVFEAIISAFEPKRCIELGILEGYSTIAIAKQLKANKVGTLDAYDLFEEYPYRHSTEKEVKKNLEDAGVSDVVNIHKMNADYVHKHYDDNSVGFLHIDLSNTGAIVRKMMDAWDKKMVYGGLIVFEGGSKERDNVRWMIDYEAAPIKTEIDTNPIIEANYVYCTYFRFPSLTCLLKKR